MFLLGLGCTLSLSTIAQTEKGAKYLGVSAGNLSYYKGDNESNISGKIYPRAGIFLIDNLLVGASLQLGYGRSIDERNAERNVNRTLQYGILPFARYYFSGTGTHRFFGQLNTGLTWYNFRFKTENTAVFNQRSTNRSLVAEAGLGYNYFLTPSAALEVTAGYARYDNKLSDSSGSFNLLAGFAVFLPSKQAATVPTQ